MNSQSPFVQWCICIGPDDGCQAVPEPIAPIDMTFVSLEPTRIPISSPFMMTSGPMSIAPVSAPDIPVCPMEPGDGLAIGIGMFIFCSGDGDGAGIGIPGVCRCGCVPAGDGDGAGV